MSLRRRLLLTLGLSFCVLWTLAATWLYSDLRNQMSATLDQRLAASARMAAGLIAQLPDNTWAEVGDPILSIPQSTGVACQISLPAGQVLLRTHGDFAGRLDAPTAGFTNRVIDGQRWRLFTYIQNGLHITTADRLAERVTLQRDVLVVAAVPFVVALLGSLVLLWFGLRRGLRPLEKLRGALSHREPDTLHPIDIGKAPAELAPVIGTLNRLLARTAEALNREQRFTSDAAHELRTPLTAIKTQVQLASRVPPDRAQEAISRAETAIARLQRTLEQLLTLARIEADQLSGAKLRTRSALIVDTALADLDERERICVEQDPHTHTLDVPLELAAAALRNLLQNALQHTPAHAPITLEVRAERDSVVFTVRDRGDWPAEQSTEFLTRRFWRHNRAQNNAHGSGLGLAIVAAIAEHFGAALHFRAREGGGLIAQLTLAHDNHKRR